MHFLRILLWPFSLLYGGILLLRNWLYDAGWMRSVRFGIPVISVGNLTVGGTGKTPHVEYLLRLLSAKQVAVLSRGYRRKTKGFVLADASATAHTLGDEPYQYHRDFPEVTVAVCESRPAGIAELLQRKPDTDVVVLDDAMQHRPVQPSLNLMLTDYGRLFFRDWVLPMGLLREPRQGARRADAIIVTKCPTGMGATEMEAVRREVHRYSPTGTPVFFSGFRYGQAIPIGSAKQLGKRIVLLTGIAHAAPLRDYLQQEGFDLVQHLEYPDHHHYTLQDMQKVRQLLAQDARLSVLTTRKDAAKLTDAGLRTTTASLPLFYLPIEVCFLQEQQAFDALITGHLISFYEAQ
jgi:tetraacyldisaccharide 4'-kinase